MNFADEPPCVQSADHAEPASPAGPPPPALFDSHCHLAVGAFDGDRPQVVARAKAAGVVGCLAVAVDGESARAVRQLASILPGWASPTAGIHPTENAITDEGAWRDIELLFEEGGFAAVGETGIDAFHTGTSIDDQVASLHRHLRLAVDRHLPVVLHCRDAFPRMIEELELWRGAPLRGVLHCFTGLPSDIGPLLDAGLHIGVGGAATYRSNVTLRQSVRDIPIDRLLLETDAPWLSPVPMRGRRNEPAFIAHVAAMLAADRHMTVAALAAATTANALALLYS